MGYARIEVIMIVGSPGSGKSTVLNHLIDSLSGQKPAVCMHHAAKSFHLETTPVQSPLTTPIVHYSEVFDFGSGCICCSPDGDLTRTLTSLAGEIESGRQVPPDLLFVEVTGLGDPRPFIRLFNNAEIIKQKFRLSQILAVLHSGTHCVAQLAETAVAGSTNKALQQLKCASAVVLNREAVNASIAGQVEALVAKLNPEAIFLGGCKEGNVDWNAIQDLSLNALREKHHCGPECDAEEMLFVKPPGSGHDATYGTMSIVERGGVSESHLLAELESMLEQGVVDRVKGFISVATQPQRGTAPVSTAARVIDGVVGELKSLDALTLESQATLAESNEIAIDIADSAAWKSALEEPGMNRIYLSGRAMDETVIRASILKAFVEPGYEVVASIDLELTDISEAVKRGVTEGEYSYRIEMGQFEVALYWIDGIFQAVEFKPGEVEGEMRRWADVLADRKTTLKHDVCVVDDLVYVKLADGVDEPTRWSTIDLEYK